MLSEKKIGVIAQSFKEQGFGLVLLSAFTDTDMKVRCFSTVSSHDVYCVLESTAAKASLMDFDQAEPMTGSSLIKSPNKDLNAQAEWAADFLEREEPMIIGCVSQNVFSVFVVGDIPMLTYIAVRMLTTLKQKGGLVLNPFEPSDN